MVQIVVHSLQDCRYKIFTQPFPFAVNIPIASTREVNTFERACLILLRLHNLRGMPVTLLVDDQRLSPFQFMHIFGRHIHGRLDYWTFACQDHNLVIGIVKRRTDAPRIAHAERFAAPGQSADHETTVPLRGTTFQDIRQVDICLDRMGDIHSFQPFGFVLPVQAFDLTVQTVPHLF